MDLKSPFLISTRAFISFQVVTRVSPSIYLNRDFSTLVNWFVDNRLSVHFGEDKTKSILFTPKHRSKSIGQIDISYKDIKIKQYAKVTYLGCVLDECLTGESMAKVCTKVTSKLKFLYKKHVPFKRLEEAFM